METSTTKQHIISFTLRDIIGIVSGEVIVSGERKQIIKNAKDVQLVIVSPDVKLKHHSTQREGWHYEFSDKEKIEMICNMPLEDEQKQE